MVLPTSLKERRISTQNVFLVLAQSNLKGLKFLCNFTAWVVIETTGYRSLQEGQELREKRAYLFSCRIFLSSTINGYFGSGIMTDTGIVLNNEMADFSIPGVQNVQGAGPPTVRNPPLAQVTSWNVVGVLLARYAVFPVWGGLRDEPNAYNFNVFVLHSVRFLSVCSFSVLG